MENEIQSEIKEKFLVNYLKKLVNFDLAFNRL